MKRNRKSATSNGAELYVQPIGSDSNQSIVEYLGNQGIQEAECQIIVDPGTKPIKVFHVDKDAVASIFASDTIQASFFRKTKGKIVPFDQDDFKHLLKGKMAVGDLEGRIALAEILGILPRLNPRDLQALYYRVGYMIADTGE